MRKLEVHLVGEYDDYRTGVQLRIGHVAFPGVVEGGGDLVTSDLSDLTEVQLAYLAVEFDDLARKMRTMAREKA